MTGKENVITDSLSHWHDYVVVQVPLVHEAGVKHKAIDTFMYDYFEFLLRGFPAVE